MEVGNLPGAIVITSILVLILIEILIGIFIAKRKANKKRLL